jgi:HSP20 family protein
VKKSGKKKKAGQKERMRKFDEKTKESEETKSGEGSEGVAEGVLRGVGQMIPRLGALIKGLEKSPAFKERLEKVNQEIERKLKQAPLKRTGDRGPHVESSFSTRTLVPEEKPSFGRKVKKPTVAPTPEPKEPVVDVFDEKDHLRIIAELPGVAEREMKISLEKNTLIIRINSPGWKPEHKVTLPYAPKGKLEKVLRKGILEIKVGKD